MPYLYRLNRTDFDFEAHADSWSYSGPRNTDMPTIVSNVRAMGIGPNRDWQPADMTARVSHGVLARAAHLANFTPAPGSHRVPLRPLPNLIPNIILPSLNEESTELDASEGHQTEREEIPRDLFRTSHPPNQQDMVQADMDSLVEYLQAQVSTLSTRVDRIVGQLNELGEQAENLGEETEADEELAHGTREQARQISLERMERATRREVEQTARQIHQIRQRVASEVGTRTASRPSLVGEAANQQRAALRNRMLGRLEEHVARLRVGQVEQSTGDENAEAGNGADGDHDVDGQAGAEESSAGH